MVVVFAMLLACQPKTPVTPVQEVSVQEVPVQPTPTPTPVPPVTPPVINEEPARCGGIAGLRCPSGTHCEDDPSDGCDPQTGADCIGLCLPGAATGVRRQLGNPQSCLKIDVACKKGERSYHDETGCGCEPDDGKGPL